MKVVAILGGLGSQMFKYAFYLALEERASDDCCICTFPFYTMHMWNGYELKKVFGIDSPDLADEILKDKEVCETGDYASAILKTLYKKNLNKPVYRMNRGVLSEWREIDSGGKNNGLVWRWLNKIHGKLKRTVPPKESYIDVYPAQYTNLEGDILFDEFNHTSDIYIKCDTHNLKDVFTFPPFTDKKNIEISTQIHSENSVALHVRRSDHMYDNQYLFTSDYFRKAVNLIKSKERNPVFYIFSEESMWCKNNAALLGLDLSVDNVFFVDWNRGEDSFRDMQLMTYCKHNILAISSFSWWGYYLSERTEKIVCAPQGYWFEVQYHF